MAKFAALANGTPAPLTLVLPSLHTYAKLTIHNSKSLHPHSTTHPLFAPTNKQTNERTQLTKPSPTQYSEKSAPVMLRSLKLKLRSIAETGCGTAPKSKGKASPKPTPGKTTPKARARKRVGDTAGEDEEEEGDGEGTPSKRAKTATLKGFTSMWGGAEGDAVKDGMMPRVKKEEFDEGEGVVSPGVFAEMFRSGQ
jgi:hypothetical protein